MRKQKVFKSDLVNLISNQTGLSLYESHQAANKFLLEAESKSLADMIYGQIANPVIDAAKQRVATAILSQIGLDPNKILGRIIINSIEEMDFLQIKKYFDQWEEGACEAWLDVILNGVVEAIAEYFIDKMVGYFKQSIAPTAKSELGISDKFMDNIQGVLGGEEGIDAEALLTMVTSVIREKIFDVIFTEEIRQKTVETLCDAMSNMGDNLNISSTLSGITDSVSGIFSDDEEEE